MAFRPPKTSFKAVRRTFKSASHKSSVVGLLFGLSRLASRRCLSSSTATRLGHCADPARCPSNRARRPRAPHLQPSERPPAAGSALDAHLRACRRLGVGERSPSASTGSQPATPISTSDPGGSAEATNCSLDVSERFRTASSSCLQDLSHGAQESGIRLSQQSIDSLEGHLDHAGAPASNRIVTC